jgi:hypothetical protein
VGGAAAEPRSAAGDDDDLAANKPGRKMEWYCMVLLSS